MLPAWFLGVTPLVRFFDEGFASLRHRRREARLRQPACCSDHRPQVCGVAAPVARLGLVVRACVQCPPPQRLTTATRRDSNCSSPGVCARRKEAFFIFLYFSKLFFTEIYFRFHNLQVCTPTARQGPAAPLPGGRGLNVIKISILSH